MEPSHNDYWQQADSNTLTAAPPLSSQSIEGSVPASKSLQTAPDQPLAQWQASEYLHHEKGGTWFIGAGTVLIGLLTIAILFHLWTFVALLVVMAVAVVVYVRRPPRVLQYTLFKNGLHISDKQYAYHDFKAFGVRQEGGLYSIVLLPLQRFAPSVNLFFDPAEGEHIVDILGSRLPMQSVEPDLIDKITRKLGL